MKHESLDHLTEMFRTLAPTLPGARLQWMNERRLRAFEQFRVQGFPTRADEAWKYTNLDGLNQKLLHFSPGADHRALEQAARLVRAHEWADSHRLVFVDGVWVPELSDIGELASGVFIGSLASALEQIPERIRAQFADDRWPDGLAAFNAAFARDGYVMLIPSGVELGKPLHVMFIGSDDNDLAMQPLNVVVAGSHARCAVVEQYVGDGDAWYYTNAMTRIDAGDHADVQHYRVQQEAPNAVHTATVLTEQRESSRFSSYAFSFGAALARSTIVTKLGAPRTSTTLDGLYVGGGKQHLDHYTMIDHAHPQCASRETYRGILDGSAHGVFNGRIVVRQDAQKTDADQANHNLLLSRSAEIDTKPQLEIFADDVRCTHGTTVGQLDETQLFYLRARGIDERAARALLTFAFARDVIDRVAIEPLKARLEATLLTRMADAPADAGEA
ncbi:Fe-S cluster assembly protein SufD [Paraburkholderia rhizosphaerae]|uniref:Iron-regulated ABC transporter permease protein SufD n=1 Tax=Paraburkholderia rhizosphaerae TaxID=480658 RepID=A0A4R8LXD8_9BURK|nr:Fe-S cluster assembly protein SufD [Paraburkholderia rhizosphaerae]TDY51477.1 iron-regulated ABC transporter permease protein SufD [Paraburkholderia rhizosphaerae]